MVIIDKGKSKVEGEVSELLDSSEMLVKIVVEDHSRVIELLDNTKWKARLTDNFNKTLNFRIDNNEIPLLARFLVKNGVQIRAITPKRSLEDYFISITGDE